jgi:hypothetical protein
MACVMYPSSAFVPDSVKFEAFWEPGGRVFFLPFSNPSGLTRHNFMNASNTPVPQNIKPQSRA